VAGSNGVSVSAVAVGIDSLGVKASASGSGAVAIKASALGGAVYAGDFDGRVRVTVLEIEGGADLSEPYEIRDNPGDAPPCPGTVVSIDPERPGELRTSRAPYDRRVAGIVSGAGGVKPGLLMGQRGSAASGVTPVALSGRVYCRADAEAGGKIEPGDLLTTSATPGHAMKVTDYSRAQGAILGKAMSPLRDGRGLVLVLVTLQ